MNASYRVNMMKALWEASRRESHYFGPYLYTAHPSDATTCKTRGEQISNTEFIWDKEAKQVYGQADGTQIIDVDDFSKAVGAHFTLDARDEVLAIVQYPKSLPSEIVWGSIDGSNLLANTEINVVNGQLRIVGVRGGCQKGKGTHFLWGRAVTGDSFAKGGTLQVVMSNASVFTLSNLSTLRTHDQSSRRAGAGVRLWLHDESSFSARSIDTFVFSGELNVLDSASMNVVASSIVMEAGDFIVASDPAPSKKECSFSVKSTKKEGGVGVRLSDFLFAGKSLSTVSAKCISLSDITVKHRAVLLVRADGFDFSCGKTNMITLGAGSSSVSIVPCSEGADSTFNFLDYTQGYPEGMFNFVNDEGGNASVLKLSCSPEVGQINAMLDRKLLCVNGLPVTCAEEMSIVINVDVRMISISNK